MTQEAGAFQYRDRDPPPSWNGEKPESTLKPYLETFSCGRQSQTFL